MSARKMQRARARALAAGTAISIGAVALPAAASADSVVTNNNDSGAGSFRQAVSDSNADPDPDTITFAPNVTGTITLAARLNVTRTTTIDGPGASVLSVISPGDGVFLLNDFSAGSSSLEIEGLSFAGNAAGSGSFGGAVAVGGRSGGLTIRNCTIAGASSGNEGGAIGSKGSTVNVIGSVISGGQAADEGGAIWGQDSNIRVVDSLLTGSRSNSSGGAIALVETGSAEQSSLTITNSRVTDNTALDDGGAIAVNAADGPTVISQSTISGNDANRGAGLYFGYGEALTVEASTFSGNDAGDSGGGMFVYAPGGATEIDNTTVSGNSATNAGAGIYSFGYFDKPVKIANSTIASNGGTGTGAGIFQFGYDGSGAGYEGPDEITLSSTIVANNVSGGGLDVAQGQVTTGSIRVDHSLIGSMHPAARITENPAGTNKLNTGAIALGPLADNGGPTQTMLPALGGPAIDAGFANGLASDQRGLARTVDQPLTPASGGSDGTDIGAVEVADSEISGAGLKAKKKQKQKGKKVKLVVEVSAAEPVTAGASGSVKLGKKKLPLTQPSTDLDAGERKKLTLKPKGKRAAKKIAKTLAKGKAAKASVAVTFADPAGNTEQASIGAKLVD